MRSITKKTLSAAAMAICLFGYSAQSAEDKSHRLDGAWTSLLAGAEPVLTAHSDTRSGKDFVIMS